MRFINWWRTVPNTAVAETEVWNGTAWTEVNESKHCKICKSSSWTHNSSIAAGGQPVVGNVESWNGTSWTEVADLNTLQNKVGFIRRSK